MSQGILFCLVFVIAITLINCDCELRIDGIMPIFVKDFGSKKIKFRPQSSRLPIKQNDYLQVFCASKIRLYDEERSFSDAVIGCRDNSVVYKRSSGESFQYIGNYQARLSCETQPLSLYESNRTLTKCDEYISYGIGLQMSNAEDYMDDIDAAICYDLERLNLKYIKYIAQEHEDFVLPYGLSQQQNDSNALNIELSTKLDHLNNYREFIIRPEFESQLNMLRSQNPLMKLFDFDYESLLQSKPLYNKLQDFSYFFNTIWWRVLLQGNWHEFLTVLQQRTTSNKYIVYIGTYGNTTIPTNTSTCNQSETFNVVSESSTVVAPAYIWAYLKALDTDGVPEEFVVLAHNSPFKPNPNSNEFCDDMCDEISWLRSSKFGSLRKIPTLGYTFCCRPQAVAKVIDYFPWQQQELTMQTQTATVKSIYDDTTMESLNEIEES